MLGTTITKNSIASIRNQQQRLQSSKDTTTDIRQLQREMVALSFQTGKGAEIRSILEQLKRLRTAE